MPNLEFIRQVGPWQWTFRTAIRQFYKRLLRRDHKMRLPTGEWMVLPISSRFASEAYVTQADVDWGSERLLSAIVDGSGVFLDVGANIGYYSLYLAPRVAFVYSFEPDPRVRLSLEQNAKGNPKLEIVPCAVGAVQGRASFVLEQSAELSHLGATGEKGDNHIEVQVITLDAFAAARSLSIAAIKIDAEGHDIEVLEGALTILTQQGPIVLVESDPDADIFRIAAKVGYRVLGYVRHPETRKSTFMELRREAPKPGETKMLFLVPERLKDRIMEQAMTC